MKNRSEREICQRIEPTRMILVAFLGDDHYHREFDSLLRTHAIIINNRDKEP
jgi:hypothetical protein